MSEKKPDLSSLYKNKQTAILLRLFIVLVNEEVAFRSLCTYWEPFNFFPGKLVPRGFLERETMQCNGSHDHQLQMGQIATICGHDYAKMDSSTGATLGKVSFLVRWHIWTNLAAKIAVNRWKVHHVYAVCDHVGLKYLTGKGPVIIYVEGGGGGRETLKGGSRLFQIV